MMTAQQSNLITHPLKIIPLITYSFCHNAHYFELEFNTIMPTQRFNHLEFCLLPFYLTFEYLFNIFVFINQNILKYQFE